MSFADDAFELRQRTRKSRPCNTGAWLASLDDRDRQALDALLADGHPVAHVWRLAVKYGLDAAETRFRVHFRRDCGCFANVEVAA
ncbi:hypothetical protein DFR75_11237 [Nocardia ignorata]|uniref:Uncharacterized protein n=1 Tax=Nocardia ignorata TaxID=145285 RepID=A0A4R6NZ09_NOCIG|nr:hypothetical protein DFR75_11237 [Nocardia ignorata]